MVKGQTMALVLAVGMAVGCPPLGRPDNDVYIPPYDAGSDTNQQERDQEEYAGLQRELDQGMEEVLGDIAGELQAVGNRLFWQEFRSMAPSLHSLDDETEGGEKLPFEADPSQESDILSFRFSPPFLPGCFCFEPIEIIGFGEIILQTYLQVEGRCWV